MRILSSFHWASRFEVHSVSFLPGLNALAVPTEPFPSRTGVITSPVAAVDLEAGEEFWYRASARLVQLLDWNSPRDTTCELDFIEPLREQLVGGAACLLLRRMQLVPTPRDAALAGRICWVTSRTRNATENPRWKSCWLV